MSRYTHDPVAFGEEVLCSGFMQIEMLRRAYQVADRAVELASPHFDATDTDGDHYLSHFSVDSGVQHRKTSRAYGRVTNDHDAAIDIEYGTAHAPRQRILGRALDSAGDL